MALTATLPSPAAVWSERTLDASRVAAITAAAAVPWSTALVNVALGVLLVSLILSGRPHQVLRDALAQPLGIAIAVLYAVLLLGLLYSEAPRPDQTSSLWSWRKPAFMLILLGLFAAPLWKRRFVWTLIAVGAVSVLLSSVTWALGLAPRIPTQPGIVLQNHTVQGMFFALAAFACTITALGSPSPRLRGWLLVLAALLALNVIFVSTGRSGYLALAAMVAVLGIRLLGWRRLPVVIAGLAAVSVLAYGVSPQIRDRLAIGIAEATTYREAESLTSMGFRMNAWENTIALVRERPLLGYGTGSFGKVYSERVKERYQDWRGWPASDPHNQYLMILTEQGLLGLAAFLALLAVAFRAGVRAADGYGWIAVGALLAWLLTCLVNTHFRTFPEGHMIALLLGVMLAAPVRRRTGGG